MKSRIQKAISHHWFVRAGVLVLMLLASAHTAHAQVDPTTNFRMWGNPSFNRQIGLFRDVHLSPEGEFLSDEEWGRRKHDWLPSGDDQAYVHSLMMKATLGPGEFAGWIAPPARGINKQNVEFDYIRFAQS